MDLFDDELVFTAGQLVPGGTYIRVDIWVERRLVLDGESVLPASHDGRVAVYRRIPELPIWLSRVEPAREIDLVA